MKLTFHQRDCDHAPVVRRLGPAVGWSNGRFDFVPAYRRPVDVARGFGPARVLVRSPASADDSAAWALDFELTRVLAIPGAPWHPEPIDRVGDSVVFAAPPGRRLVEQAPPLDRLARFLGDLLRAIERLHESGLSRGPLEPGDFLLDESGRWTDLGTDLVTVAEAPARARGDLARWSAFASGLLAGCCPAWPVLLPPDLAWPAGRVDDGP